MARAKRCENCRFWQGKEEDEDDEIQELDGICRRYAPRTTLLTNDSPPDCIPIWAETNRTDWCGEWEPEGDKTYASIIADWLEERGHTAAAGDLRHNLG